MENLGSDCPLGRPHSDRLGRVSIAFHTLPCVRGQDTQSDITSRSFVLRLAAYSPPDRRPVSYEKWACR